MPIPTNPFIWADLSTFDLPEAKRFYRDCFGWGYQAAGDDYVVCAAGRQPAAGLFPMPEFFRKIKMPSFWMSYIKVEDIQETVRLAEQYGAKVEVKPQTAPGGGQIALIRDPAGAGFTCYEGNALTRNDTRSIGTPVWNELHISDLAKVEPFYSGVFGWAIRPTPIADRYEITLPHHTQRGASAIAGITVTPNALKVDKEYWGVYFAVPGLAGAQAKIEKAGGQIVAEQPLGSHDALLAYDSQGAAFYIIEDDSLLDTTEPPQPTSGFKWRAILGLVIVSLAVVFDATWAWGLLFLLWLLPDLRSGHTHFLEHVQRRTNPIVYWLIMVTWVVLSLYLLSTLFTGR